MNRPFVLSTGLAALLLCSPAVEAQPAAATPRRSPAMVESIQSVLEQSHQTGKGVLVYMGSHAIGGVVTKIGEHTLELKNREYGRIVLRLEKIDGVAGN